MGVGGQAGGWVDQVLDIRRNKVGGWVGELSGLSGWDCIDVPLQFSNHERTQFLLQFSHHERTQFLM